MSNYLTNLTRKHFGNQEKLRPRLPSLFETWTAAETVSADVSPILNDLESSRIPPRKPDFGYTGDASVPSAEPAVALSEPEIIQTQTPPPVPVIPPKTLQPHSPPTTAPPDSNKRLEDSLESDQQLDPPEPVKTTVIERVRTERETLIQRESKLTAPESLTEQPKELDMAPPHPPRSSAAKREVKPVSVQIVQKPPNSNVDQPILETSAPQEARPPPVLPPPVLTPAPRRSYEPALPTKQKPAEPTPQAAPTIQVSIGRIEVRATSSATPAPKRRANTPPVMSLDEYLQQRRGGGR